MADIEALALSAQRKLDNGEATSEIDAIGKAIRGVGITFPPDVKRLKIQVGTQFARNKHERARHIQRRA